MIVTQLTWGRCLNHNTPKIQLVLALSVGGIRATARVECESERRTVALVTNEAGNYAGVSGMTGVYCTPSTVAFERSKTGAVASQ